MNFKIEWLRYFIVFCEFKNFTETAKKLNITTSCLSQNIKALEDSIKIKLIVRTGKNNTITEQGYLFLEKAKETLFKFEKIEYEFKEINQTSSKNILTIGWTNIWGSNILPEIIEFMMNKNKDFYPKIYAFTIEEAIKYIEINEIDFAIVTIKNDDDLYIKNNNKISYISGKKVFFTNISNSDNSKKISLSGAFQSNENFEIQTASINSLIYLCEKDNFTTCLPEILVNKNMFKSSEIITDKYIQPALIWNKDKQINKTDLELINFFTELSDI
jgi:hypothetical protein